MKRLTTRKTRKMLEEKAIEEVEYLTLEAPAQINRLKDCEDVVENFTPESLRKADYYKVGSFMNIESSQRSYCQISVFYYEEAKGGRK